MNRLIFASVWIALQVGYLGGWSVYEAWRMLPGRGESILVRTAPVDPRDLLRGQYMRLRYSFSSAPRTVGLKEHATAWVLMRPEETDGIRYYEPVGYYASKPGTTKPGDVVIRGVGNRYNRIDFGIERYFVPEGTETPNTRDLTVRLRIGDDHRPRIEDVYLNGKPWP